jgi:hypothetical protein
LQRPNSRVRESWQTEAKKFRVFFSCPCSLLFEVCDFAEIGQQSFIFLNEKKENNKFHFKPKNMFFTSETHLKMLLK